MVINDAEARKAVRQLMEQFDAIQAQHLSIAYVLAERDPAEYTRLLEAADKATATVIQPIADADLHRRGVYAALDNPDADWSKAILSMLNQGLVTLTLDQAIDELRLRNKE